VTNLERHSLDYNLELTDVKNELFRLRGESDRYDQKIAFLWERLHFQDRLQSQDTTLEQVVNVYREEIAKIRQATLPFVTADSTHRGNKEKTSKSGEA
jgi:hypothetical protein